MDPAAKRQALELDIRRHCDARNYDGATAAALRGYGREILEFLAAYHRSESDASEVYSLVAEGIWTGIQRFEWTSSFRTWAYTIARYTSYDYRRKTQRRVALVGTALPEGSEAFAIAQQVRSETISYLRTQRRTRIMELRDTLPEEDRALLMLRVDRELAWIDLARILHESETPLDEESLKREAARLRKRFQLVKEKIYELARKEGLVGPDKGDRAKPRS